MKKSILILICLMTLTINAFSQTWATSGGNFYTNPNSTKVGIGTIPSEFLDITGNSSNTAERLLSGSPFNYCRYQLGRNAVESTFGVAAGSGQFVTGSLASDIILRTEAASQRLILNSGTGNATLIVYNSKVGVNTTSPSKTFDVNGDINFSGALYANGSSGSTGQFLISQGTSTPVWQSGNSYSWLLIGNSGTTPGTNFLGTTDAQKLIFKVNNFQSGLIDWDNSTGTANTFFGYRIGISNTTGTNNSALGYNALFNNVAGNNNTATGFDALFNNTSGICNTGNGDSVLFSNTGGKFNTGLGVEAGFNSITGSDNTYVGAFAGKGSSSNPYSDVVCIGYKAGFVNNTSDNVFIGSQSAIVNTSGGENVFIGFQSGLSNTTGDANTYVGFRVANKGINAEGNVAIGESALYNNKAGGQATAIGSYALYNAWDYNTTPFTNDNVALGFMAHLGSNNYSGNTGLHNTALGYKTLYSNSTGYGNTASGNSALYFNSTGNNNTADGDSTLFSNTTGNFNTATGTFSLFSNTIGRFNTSDGFRSLFNNTTAEHNVAVGSFALFTQSFANGGARWSSFNVAVGDSVLYSNQPSSTSIGVENTGVGNSALFNNTTGFDNTAVGFRSLFHNIASKNNNALGAYSLYSNQTGEYNIAVGDNALYSNSSGNYNIAIGDGALHDNTTSTGNIAIGASVLNHNTTGNNNIAIGSNALYYAGTNNSNTGIGYQAYVPAGYNYCTFLGYNSSAPSITHDYDMQFGNSSCNYIYANVSGFSGLSDRRVKNNIKENVPGLAFIKLLKPVTFHYDIHTENSILGYPTKTTIIPEVLDTLGNVITPASTITTIDTVFSSSKYDIENIVQTGLVAQQVDSAAMQIGYNFNGISRPNGPNQLYHLNYVQFIAPLIKGEQELSISNDSLKKHVKTLDSLMNILKLKDSLLNQNINNLMLAVANCCVHGALNKNINTNNNDTIRNTNIKLSLSETPELGDAQPNPNSGNTQIPYFLPENTADAQIIFTDILGKLLRKETLQGGYGMLNIDTNDLPNGVYSYTMIIDGKIFNSKKMICSK